MTTTIINIEKRRSSNVFSEQDAELLGLRYFFHVYSQRTGILQIQRF